MTETDATKRPLSMPEDYIPYLEKHRIYKLFKDMTRDLVLSLPKDHLKHMKQFLNKNIHNPNEANRIIMLVSPELDIDVYKVVKDMIKDLGVFVITRRYIMDCYEKHEDYVTGCVSPDLMSEVTKMLTLKGPVPQAGWLMFDHPCTVREAECLQQDGVLPTVTLVLMPPPPAAAATYNPHTTARAFFDQDFEGLKYVYKATLKEVHIEPNEEPDKVSAKCFNAIHACAAGAQSSGQGHHVLGAPAVYRVLLIGPRGSGRRTQADMAAKHFGLVCIHFEDLIAEAKEKHDEIGERLRNYGPSLRVKADVVRRRIMSKDCIDYGWVLTGYPTSGIEFEQLENMKTPPNRIIILSLDFATCKSRIISSGVDWCTGERVPIGSGPRVNPHPNDQEDLVDQELDYYFTEALAELRAAAGLTAVEIKASESPDHVQVKIQAAIISAPGFDIECCAKLRNVHGE